MNSENNYICPYANTSKDDIPMSDWRIMSCSFKASGKCNQHCYHRIPHEYDNSCKASIPCISNIKEDFLSEEDMSI